MKACVYLHRYGLKAEAIDAAEKIITLSDGRKIKYNKLLSTIPLDITLSMLGKVEEKRLTRLLPARIAVKFSAFFSTIVQADLAERLTYSSSHIIGLGLR